MRIKKRTYVLLFILGLVAGVFFGLQKAKASSPEGEASTTGGITYYYDESWKATQAIVSRKAGANYRYEYFYPYGEPPAYPLPNEPTDKQTDPAAELGTDDGGGIVKLFPKMVVTKWKVHGHIHF